MVSYQTVTLWFKKIVGRLEENLLFLIPYDILGGVLKLSVSLGTASIEQGKMQAQLWLQPENSFENFSVPWN